MLRRSPRLRAVDRSRLVNRRLRVESLEARQLLSAMSVVEPVPMGATARDTGEYLLGRVAVTPVLLESNGQIDPSTEDWTTEEVNAVLANLAEGAQWWADTLSTLTDRHSLEFVVDDQFAATPPPTPYEPISRRSNDFPLYVGQFLADQGYESGTLADAMLAFNHDQRVAHGTDWAFTVFIVDSSYDALHDDGRFDTSGTFTQAFAFAGGLFFVTPSGRPASTYAHELGHIFWARDEYAGAGSWTDRRGYYDSQNLNASDNPTPGFVHQPSIMSAGEVLKEAYEQHVSPASTLAMVGWQDSDGDGVFDVLDVPLEFDASAVYLEETRTLRVVGNASAATLPNLNSSGLQSDITLNRISRLEYRVDGGPWTTATTPDAQQVQIDASIPLDPAFDTVELRVIDARTGITSPTIAVPRFFPASSKSSATGFVFVDRDGDGNWDAEEPLLESVWVGLGDASSVTRGRVEPDDFADGVIPADQPGVHIEATGFQVDGRLGARSGRSSSPAEFYYFDSSSFSWNNRWGYDPSSSIERQFNATLESPTSAARLTAIGGMAASYARLEAYDRDGILIGRDTVGPLAVGQSATMQVQDPEGAIHRVVAFGHAETHVGLDDFRFGPETGAPTDALGHFSLEGLPDGTYSIEIASLPSIYAVPDIPLQVTVAGGASVPLAVPLTRIPSRWQNPAEPLDTTNDGLVGPIDALMVINDLNRIGARVLSDSDPDAPYIDVNGDGQVSPLDALQIINYLNRGEGSGEGPAGAGSPAPRGLVATSSPSLPAPSGSPAVTSASTPALAGGWSAAVDQMFAEGESDFTGTFGRRTALSIIPRELGTDASRKLDKLNTLDKLGTIEVQFLRPAVLGLSGAGVPSGHG